MHDADQASKPSLNSHLLIYRLLLQVLQYLDYNGTQPAKYASALLYFGELEEPEWR